MNTQNAANTKRTDQSGRDARRRISPPPLLGGSDDENFGDP